MLKLLDFLLKLLLIGILLFFVITCVTTCTGNKQNHEQVQWLEWKESEQ